MPKLIVKLKQNTPMVHFQAEESGATLRASAVKPALDKFLISLLGFAKTKPWMHDTTNKALNYRMTFQINPNNNPNNNEILENNKLKKGKPYFGKSEGVLSKDLIMTIISEEEDLICEIKENIKDFFILNNFGIRGTKGYGSFQVYSINNERPLSYKEEDIAKAIKLLPERFEYQLYKLPKSYHDQINDGKNDKKKDWEIVLEAINDTYSKIKREKDSTKEIKRFASSLIFKPLRFGDGNLHVFILLKKIPTKEEFSLVNFMEEESKKGLVKRVTAGGDAR